MDAKRLVVLTRPARARRAAQRGVVLLVALVVLVAITIAAVAMIRSVDTATMVSGNLAFQQSATQAADRGIEAAVAMLKDPTFDLNTSQTGYYATTGGVFNPGPNKTWQQFWAESLKDAARYVGQDNFGNKIYFVVHRLCPAAGPPSGCVSSPVVQGSRGNDAESPLQITAATQIYYRVTVQVAGPRRTESYVQSHISM